MRNKKFNKELLSEELKRFKLMSEYNFFEDRAGDPKDTENKLILGDKMYEAEDDENPTAEEPAGDEEALGFGNEEPKDDATAEEPAGDEEALGFGNEEPKDDTATEEPMEDEDTVELDVTQLVKGSEEAKASADAANQKIDQLMQMVAKLENATKGMDAISSKIDNLEAEIEKRAPTEQEKLEMRSLSSAPYNLKLTDFWKDKTGMYDVMGNEKTEPKEYVLTNDEVNKDYSETDIKNSFDDDNPYEEEEI